MNSKNRVLSPADLVAILEDEAFYLKLRQKEIDNVDGSFIQEFISKTLTRDEWNDFLGHCVNNQIDPYKEMREIIYSTFAKVLKSETR